MIRQYKSYFYPANKKRIKELSDYVRKCINCLKKILIRYKKGIIRCMLDPNALLKDSNRAE